MANLPHPDVHNQRQLCVRNLAVHHTLLPRATNLSPHLELPLLITPYLAWGWPKKRTDLTRIELFKTAAQHTMLTATRDPLRAYRSPCILSRNDSRVLTAKHYTDVTLLTPLTMR